MASQRPPQHSPLQHAPLLGVFEKLVVDHIQMPQVSDSMTGQKVSYILSLVDQANHWVELIPVPDCTAKTTARAIHTHWISRYGAPKTLQSDLGSAFVSKLFQELCSLYNIEHATASSQNHKSVSRAEVTHRLLRTTLRKVYAQNPNWSEWLPEIQLSLRSSIVTTTGLSPAFMIFHRELCKINKYVWIYHFHLMLQRCKINQSWNRQKQQDLQMN